MDDKRLDYLGSRFAGRGMATVLRITFEMYLAAPERFDTDYARLMDGNHGYNVCNGIQRLVCTN